MTAQAGLFKRDSHAAGLQSAWAQDAEPMDLFWGARAEDVPPLAGHLEALLETWLAPRLALEALAASKYHYRTDTGLARRLLVAGSSASQRGVVSDCVESCMV